MTVTTARLASPPYIQLHALSHILVTQLTVFVVVSLVTVHPIGEACSRVARFTAKPRPVLTELSGHQFHAVYSGGGRSTPGCYLTSCR